MEYQADPDFVVRRAFVDRLVRSIPSWADDWEWYQPTQAEKAPEVFLERAAAVCFTSVVDRDSDDTVRGHVTFAFLESGFGADRLADSLIGGSFLATNPEPHRFGIDVAHRLGPKLRSELAHQRATKETSVAQGFVNKLAATHPVVAESLREHLVDWDYELLPCLFMDDLVRAAIGWVETADGHRSLVALLADFEDAYGQDDLVDNLIALGFVENLPFPHEKGAEMLPLLGPNLRAEYSELFSGHDIPPALGPET